MAGTDFVTALTTFWDKSIKGCSLTRVWWGPGGETAPIVLRTLRPSAFLSSHYPVPCNAKHGNHGREKKEEGRERERRAAGRAVGITQEWFLPPHKRDKKKVFKYRLGEYSTRFQLLSQPKFNGAKLLSQSVAIIRNAAFDHWVGYYI